MCAIIYLLLVPISYVYKPVSKNVYLVFALLYVLFMPFSIWVVILPKNDQILLSEISIYKLFLHNGWPFCCPHHQGL